MVKCHFLKVFQLVLLSIVVAELLLINVSKGLLITTITTRKHDISLLFTKIGTTMAAVQDMS